jgi:hypothetical protein
LRYRTARVTGGNSEDTTVWIVSRTGVARQLEIQWEL